MLKVFIYSSTIPSSDGLSVASAAPSGAADGVAAAGVVADGVPSAVAVAGVDGLVSESAGFGVSDFSSGVLGVSSGTSSVKYIQPH